MKKQTRYLAHFFSSIALIMMLSGCTPTIQLDTPKEGITINMNVVVDHNISVTMDEKTQKTVSKEIQKGAK